MGESEEHGADLLGFVTDQLCSLLTILVLLEHHPPVCSIQTKPVTIILIGAPQ